MVALRERLPSPQGLVRLALVGFVLAWLFGPSELRLWVPIWLPFLVAVLLELQFFAGALRSRPAAARERGPLPSSYSFATATASCGSRIAARRARSLRR